MSLLLCRIAVQIFLPCNTVMSLPPCLMAVQIFLPCNHRNQPSAVLYCCTDVFHNCESRDKVSVVDAEFVTKFFRFQDFNDLVQNPVLILNTNIKKEKDHLQVNFFRALLGRGLVCW